MFLAWSAMMAVESRFGTSGESREGQNMSTADDKSSRLRRFARKMRKEPTPAERILWRVVRNRRLAGYRFRRQETFGPYILDFYCAVAKLVVELDGDSHLGQEAADRIRDQFVHSHGLMVLRIPNDWLYEQEEGVVELIARTCAERTATNAKVQHKLDRDGRFQPKPPE
jgi:very-short-patch-repair endonuclease